MLATEKIPKDPMFISFINFEASAESRHGRLQGRVIFVNCRRIPQWGLSGATGMGSRGPFHTIFNLYSGTPEEGITVPSLSDGGKCPSSVGPSGCQLSKYHNSR